MTVEDSRRIEPLLRSYMQAKLGLEESLPFHSDWLHLLVGPAIFVAVALLLRRPRTGWGPWLAVVILAALNEFADLAGLRLNGPTGGIAQYVESARDILLTISVPTLLLLFSFVSPARYRSLGLARHFRR